ncbi:hypothetical protein GCM10010406_54100 [Streptomyces thermolineatus]|uniref:Uncharacterized protein n=1 Tax=Streptomyces thermolineatus TaxID=44033 RepID=A0ABP6A6Y1_9ACTN
MTQNSAQEPDAGAGRAPEDPEERLRLLESQVQTLAQALRALARGLEEIPSEDTRLETEAARGARLAHELLLAQGM